jgi:uncharacterized protein RhaS with RHS repeats
VTETYSYDADTAQVKRAVGGGPTIVYLYGLYEEEVGGTTRRHYLLQGQVVVQRERVGQHRHGHLSLHADHLGSINAVTNGSGGVVSRQEFTPFGDVRSGIGDMTQASLDFTGQK